MIRMAHTLVDLREFLDLVIQSSAVHIQPVKQSDQQQWRLKSGCLQHETGGFFHITGIKKLSDGREHLIFCQPQSALTGLILHRYQEQVFVLLQARIEPGNSNICQYGPTIQSTPANYYRLHGGKSTPYLEYFIHPGSAVKQIAVSMQYDLGQKYYQKSKTHQYMDTTEFLPTTENMIWVSWPAIQDALRADNFFNADLRCLLGIFDWSAYTGTSSSMNDLVSLRPLMDSYFASKANAAAPWQLIALDSLTGWDMTGDGIIPRSGKGESIRWYQTRCTSREVDSWVQPLLCADSVGRVILYMKQVDDTYYFLISVAQEFGIPYQAVVLPSEVRYPGDPEVEASSAIDVLHTYSSFVQSDEGGRFYQHESLYEILEVEDIEPGEDQFWISASSLKKLYKTSDMVSFQLRALGASLITILNPDVQ